MIEQYLLQPMAVSTEAGVLGSAKIVKSSSATTCFGVPAKCTLYKSCLTILYKGVLYCKSI